VRIAARTAAAPRHAPAGRPPITRSPGVRELVRKACDSRDETRSG